MTTIDRVADVLATKGRIARGYLGLGLQPVKLDTGGIGAMATSVDPKGPGAAAGVRQGDIIVAWDGEPIRGVHQLVRALGPDSVGAKRQADAAPRRRADRDDADNRRTA